MPSFENVTLTEMLSLGLFVVSVLKSVWDFLILPRWFKSKSSIVSGADLDRVVFQKRLFEGRANKFYSLSIAIISGAVLFVAFGSDDIDHSDLRNLEVRIQQLEELPSDGKI